MRPIDGDKLHAIILNIAQHMNGKPPAYSGNKGCFICCIGNYCRCSHHRRRFTEEKRTEPWVRLVHRVLPRSDRRPLCRLQVLPRVWARIGGTAMREILFRGFYPCDDGDTVIVVNDKEVHGQWVEGNYVVQDGVVKIYSDTPNERWAIYSVIPATVGQSGLTDKNGKRIFVWDKVISHNEHHTIYGVIKFGQVPDENFKHIGFYIDWENDYPNMWNEWWRNDIGFWLEDEKCEIAGTVFDKEVDHA